MNIYFFSHHVADPRMIKELGGITAQFKGTISNIQRKGNQITFTEALFLGGQEIKCCHMIPAESILVVEGPILLQNAWLKAGVSTLLVPEIKQESGRWGSTSYKCCELLQVHQISVVTSVWCNNDVNIEDLKMQQTQVTNNRKMQDNSNLFRLLRWNQAKPVVFH